MHDESAGRLDLKPQKKWTHIWAVTTFFPFLLCRYFWYQLVAYCVCFKMIEDISKHARVTQKKILIGGKLYSQAPWPQRPKLGVRVAKGLSCDRMDSHFFPGEPPLRNNAEKRRDHGNLPYAHANFRGPPLFNTISQGGGGGGLPGKKSESIRSQLRPLATRTPSLGRCGQGAWL